MIWLIDMIKLLASFIDFLNHGIISAVRRKTNNDTGFANVQPYDNGKSFHNYSFV